MERNLPAGAMVLEENGHWHLLPGRKVCRKLNSSVTPLSYLCRSFHWPDTNRSQRNMKTRWFSRSIGVNHWGPQTEWRWVEGHSRGTDKDSPVHQERQFNSAKWLVETNDTGKSPEVHIEEFPLDVAIRWPLTTLEASLELVIES